MSMDVDFDADAKMAYFASLPKEILAVYHPEYSEKAIKDSIHKGMDIDLKSDIDGKTILMHAVLRSNASVVKLLLKYGASVDLKDKAGCTALIYASALKSSAITEILIAAKAKLNLKNKNGLTALMYSLQINDCYSNFKCLIEAGADVNKQDKEGLTVLMKILKDLWRRENYSKSLIQLLVEQSTIDLNLQDQQGYTASMYCLWHNYLFFLDWLKKDLMIYDLDIQDNNGMTVLMHAINQGYPNCSIAIIDKGINLYLQNNKGETALVLAEKHYQSGRSDFGVIDRLKDAMGIPRGITGWFKQLIGFKLTNTATTGTLEGSNAMDADEVV